MNEPLMALLMIVGTLLGGAILLTLIIFKDKDIHDDE